MNPPGVKPASEWVRADLPEPWKSVLTFAIETSQAQAFAAGVQQGMTEAAEILLNQGLPENPTQSRDESAYHAIIAARDAKIKSQ